MTLADNDVEGAFFTVVCVRYNDIIKSFSLSSVRRVIDEIFAVHLVIYCK